jgi:hypothetical protein
MCLCQLRQRDYLICNGIASNLERDIRVSAKVARLIYHLYLLDHMVVIVRLCDLIGAAISDTGRLDRKDSRKRHE